MATKKVGAYKYTPVKKKPGEKARHGSLGSKPIGGFREGKVFPPTRAVMKNQWVTKLQSAEKFEQGTVFNPIEVKALCRYLDSLHEKKPR